MDNKSHEEPATFKHVLASAPELGEFHLAGRKDGMAEAELTISRSMLVVLLRKFFGEPTRSVLDRIKYASRVELDGWLNRTYKADHIDQVFAES